ncbi:MAG: conjugal transfer protein TraF [Gammaproteobacteria bacterium]|nr:conjugal transfer protein TraF [Gammaproteobacteria bacterium]
MLATTANAASADADGLNFFAGKAQGWFWYHDPRELPPEDESPPTPPPAPVRKDGAETKAKHGPAPFSVAWLRKQMPTLLDRAIDDPNRENVESYLYAQRLVMDKSQRFSEMSQRVVYSDPFLDENNRVPIASFAKSSFLNGIDVAADRSLKALAHKAGLWVFFDSRCQLCRVHAETIEAMRKKHGFVVRYISLDGKGLPNIPAWVPDQGQSRTLNVRMTPTTVLVAPPNHFLVVSQGMMAQTQLEERMLVAAESEDLLPQSLLADVRRYDRGVLKTEDTHDTRVDGDDPVAWVKLLKDKLKGRY